jgi:hypothetical protein
MQAYTYDRQGDGYVFKIYKPHHQGLVLALFLPALFGGLFTFGITLVVWLVWAIYRLFANKAGSAIRYSNKIVSSFTVFPDRIITKKGAEIPARRLHSINIKNGYDKGFEAPTGRSSGGGWLIGGTLGAGMAAADGLTSVSSGIRSSVQNQRGKTAFYLTAEFGGQEEKLTTMDMSEVGARGLQTDVIRVLEGQTL